MKNILNQIRRPDPTGTMTGKLGVTMAILLAGLALGVLQKWMDGTPSNHFPMWVQSVDLGNYFGRLAIWILLATILSVYAKTPARAALHTFVFFISMLAGYYCYSYFVLGFLPVSYMMLWIVISFASIFLAYICWYAKGKGPVAIVISAGILGVLFAQAFSLPSFCMSHGLEVVTWLAGVLVLYRNPKEMLPMLGLSLVVAYVWQMFMPYWG